MERFAIKGIIFDLGKVVVDFDHMIAARRISRHTDRSAEEIYNLFFDSELTGSFEEGRISAQDFFAEVKKILHLSIGYDVFVSIWNEIFFLSKKNLGVYELANSLKEKYQLVMLSNVNILHLEYVKRNFQVLDPFDHVVASCQVGFRKPHPAIYQKAIELMRLEPESIFYTDDRNELIAGAQSLDIKGFVFSGLEKLKQDLASMGVMPQ